MSPFVASLARDGKIKPHRHICANDYKRGNVKSAASLHPPKRSVANSRTQLWNGLIQSLDTIRPISPHYLLPIICHTSVIIETHLWGLFHLWRILRWWKTDLFCLGITLTVALSQSRQGRNCFNILSVSLCWWNTFVLQECGQSGFTDKRKNE